tara:strand:- start:2070 stop:2480 length:411 start_codon:yes stop_codon:yes gene_type:complete
MELIMLFLSLLISCSDVEHVDGCELVDLSSTNNDMDGMLDCDETTNHTYEGEGKYYASSRMRNIEQGESLSNSNHSKCCIDQVMTGTSQKVMINVQDEGPQTLGKVIFEGEDEKPPFTLMPQEVADIVSWFRLPFS